MILESKLSGVNCSACQKEIDYFDGPVRLVGWPIKLPMCWECWHELYQFIPHKTDIVVDEESNELMHIRLEKEREQ